MTILERAFPGWAETPDAELARVNVPSGSCFAAEAARLSHQLMPEFYPAPPPALPSLFTPHNNSTWRINQ